MIAAARTAAANRPWEPWEDHFLLTEYRPGETSPEWAAEWLGRTPAEVVMRSAETRPEPEYSDPDGLLPDLSREPRLHAAETATLVRDGSPASRELAIRGNLRLAAWAAFRWTFKIPPEDRFQVACLAIGRAVDGFDPDRGICFSTYAIRTVYGGLCNEMRERGNLVRVPHSARRTRRRADEGETLTGRQAEIATAAGRRVVSLNPVRPGQESAEIHLADPGADPAELVERSLDAAELLAAVRQYAAGLSPRDRDIVERRLLSDEPETYKAIGADHGVSRARVDQVAKRSAAEIRSLIRIRGHRRAARAAA